MYINGLLSYSHTMETPTTPAPAAPATVEVGYSLVEGWLSPFHAKVGNVRVWGMALSLTDIQASMVLPAVPEGMSLTKHLLADTSKLAKTVPEQPQNPAAWLDGFPNVQMAFRPLPDHPSVLSGQPTVNASVAIIIPHASYDAAAVAKITAAIKQTVHCCTATVIHAFYQHVPPASSDALIAKLQQETGMVVQMVSSAAAQGPEAQAAAPRTYSATVLQGLAVAEAGSHEFTVLLRPDLLLSPGWLKELVSSLQQQPERVLAAQSKVLHPDGSIAHMGYGFQVRSSRLWTTPAAHLCLSQQLGEHCETESVAEPA